MKGILFTALLALSSAAPASGIVATLPNQGGGEILLTDASCPNNSAGRVVMATSEGGGLMSVGCAVTLPPDRLLVSWNGGNITLLKSSHFTLVGALPFGAMDSRPAATESRITRGHFAKFKNR